MNFTILNILMLTVLPVCASAILIAAIICGALQEKWKLDREWMLDRALMQQSEMQEREEVYKCHTR